MSDELFTRKGTIKDLFKSIYELLKEGDFEKSLKYCDKIIELDFEYPMLYENMACIKFWENRVERFDELKSDNFALASFLDSTFKRFRVFVSERNFPNNLICYDAIHLFIYNKIVDVLSDSKYSDKSYDEFLLLGLALLEVGNLEHALAVLSGLKRDNPYNGYLLSLIAETYHKLGNFRASKMYLRDALFYGPFDIDFDLMTISDIDVIIDTIKTRGRHSKSRDDIIAWMSAYSELMNILDIKRTFNEDEENNLRRKISKLEAEFRKVKTRDTVAPKLLASYSWLITYLVMNGEAGDVDEVSMLGRKMAMIDRELVEYYIKILDLKRGG